MTSETPEARPPDDAPLITTAPLDMLVVIPALASEPVLAKPVELEPALKTTFDKLRAATTKYMPPADQVLLEQLLAFAQTTAPDAARLRLMAQTGLILTDMHIDVMGITAGMLQHVAIDPISTEIIPEVADRIGKEFGLDVPYLIENIVHFTHIEQRKGKRVSKNPRNSDTSTDRRSRERSDADRKRQIETIRRMFVAMGDDPRVVVFKLADHLLRMRALDQPTEVRLALAEEARDIYAPLAGRLGMSRIECELDDLAFAQLEPEEFRRVKNLVDQVRAEQRGYIEQVCTVLTEEAAQVNIHAEVTGRYKHLWSIYNKLVRNGWDIHQIYDLIAFRIIVPTLPDCYAMLGQVHALWQPKEDRIKDFIAHPKPNGYQSLHTTVFCLDKRLAEIQIRTREMHQNAEFGVAMHWYYKDAGDTATLDKKLAPWLTQLQDWQNDLQQRTTGQEFVESTQETVGTRSQVFVFTPHGDVRELPSGSTPVDYAYRIHSNLGDRCAGARIITPGQTVTTRMVPLDYVLENGQIVEIITRKDAHPTRDWLKFVRTTAARSHISRYLKQHERDIYITVGRERFDREARIAGLGSVDSIGDDILSDVAEHFNYATIDDLFAAIGGDTVRPSAVITEVQARQPVATPAELIEEPMTSLPPLPSSEAVLNLAGAGGLLARLANCCHPLPGDPIEGYISRGRGIVIHHGLCRSLQRLREREGERLVTVDWDQMRLDRYEAAVVLTAHDRTGLLRDVTHQVQEMKINMGTVTSLTNRKGVAVITMTLQINTVKQLDEAVSRFRAIRDVENVSRDLRCLVTSGAA